MNNPDIKGLLRFFMLLLITLGSFASCAQPLPPSEALPQIKEGLLDLRTVSLVAPLELKGDWEFYKKELLTEFPAEAAYLEVPLAWDFEDFDNRNFGWGTYRIKILSRKDGADLALKIPVIGFSYKIYWNGTLLAQSGQPGSSPEAYSPGWKPGAVLLENLQSENELILQVANFTDNSSGLTETPLLGPAAPIFQGRMNSILIDIMIFGALILMAFYHVGLYIYRKKDTAPLFFGVLALILGLRPLFYGEIVFLDLFPSFDFSLLYRLGYLTFSLAVPAFMAFLNSLYPSRILGVVNKVTLGVSGFYTLLVLFAPLVVFSQSLKFFQYFTLLVGVFSLVVIIRALIQKKQGAGLFIWGFAVFFGATVLDILNSLLKLQIPQLVPAGLLFFMLFQSLIIAKKFSLAYLASEEYSGHLSKLNLSLERFIPKEVLSFLQKQSIVEIILGDHIESEMTVLFVDIRDFTSLSEKMSPDENFRFINSYLKRVGPLIRDNKGFVDKYMGDGIMALFPGSPDDALCAALGIRHALVQYNRDRAKCGYDPIRIGMGIHTGKLMLGTIGENLRMDSTVISDTVNVASRLETLTKKNGKDILLSRYTADKLLFPEKFQLFSCGTETIKGKTHPIEVYEALSFTLTL